MRLAKIVVGLGHLMAIGSATVLNLGSLAQYKPKNVSLYI